jgi:hypothetical protein
MLVCGSSFNVRRDSMMRVPQFRPVLRFLPPSTWEITTNPRSVLASEVLHHCTKQGTWPQYIIAALPGLLSAVIRRAPNCVNAVLNNKYEP